ncbi:MAG: transporter, partial [Sphingobacteriia bacterium]|nr:transporter [Sphingobacteriia bacterium]
VLALVIISVGLIISLLSIYFFDVNVPLMTGIFNGALTSTPGLAAAIEATNSPNAAIGYGIAYPIGVIAVVLFITLLPKVLKIDIKKAELDYEKSMKSSHPIIVTKHFLVSHSEVVNKPFVELKKHKPSIHCIAVNIHRAGKTIIPSKNVVLQIGDVLTVIGREDEMIEVEKYIGVETRQAPKRAGIQDVQWLLVTNKTVINKTIQSLNLFENFNASIAILRRSGIDIAPDPKTHLRFGDRLLVAADKSTMKNVAQFIGNDTKKLSGTDFLPITLGIIIGIMIGSITFEFTSSFNFSLGITGGVLISAIVLSGIGKTGPIIWTMSSNANFLLRELGLLMFLTAVGCNAGSNIVETIDKQGFLLLIIGAFITIAPLFVGWWVGTKLLKINPLALLGLITGGMTSTPGLGAAAKHSDTNIPQIAYATIYPFALVIMILFSKLIAYL